MKKNYLLLLLCMTVSCAKAQKILISPDCKKNITTQGEVVFSGSTINLLGVTITCNTLTVDNSVTTINITGNVKIVVNGAVNMGSSANNITLNSTGANSGTLTIEYQNTTPFPSTRSLQMQTGTNLILNILPK
jgi:hypothetical protein